MKITDAKLKKVGGILLKLSSNATGGDWEYLGEAYEAGRCLPKGEATKQEANQFLLGASMQRQWKASLVWQKSRELQDKLNSSKYWGKPDDLWGAIMRVPLAEWRQWWKEGKYHIYSNTCEYTRQNAALINEEYGGDARNIWRIKKFGKKAHDILICRLQKFYGVGPALADMIIGALLDTKQIDIKGADVKVDVHVCRVLSRVFEGDGQSPKNFGEQAIKITRKMHPQNPWFLDRPLFHIGQEHCYKSEPFCDECALRKSCKYYASL